MYECAIEVLNKLCLAGFDAYIVGGYPRNKYLGIDSKDIDICTSATPDDLLSIFSDVDVKYSVYGSVRLKYKEYIYEVTTFRVDKAIVDGNRYYDVEYIGNLEDDLLRRDFIINTLCIDKNGNYVDYLGARKDLDNKVVRTVKDAFVSFGEDPLRMLRAIRFATTLSFSLSSDIINALNGTKSYLSNLSFYHIKHELDLIFKSENVMNGVNYLLNLEIDKYININLSNVKYCSNYLGIWAQCQFSNDYQFSNEDKEAINKIRFILSSNPDFLNLYDYGIDLCKLVDEINNNNDYCNLYARMPIYGRDDINIDKSFIFDNVPKKQISRIYRDMEIMILNGELINEKDCIEKYIMNNI